jgi:hypothetical protein
LVEPLSLDEAFLDISGSIGLFGPLASIGRRIKEKIRHELKLVASVGVAPSKFVAKIASDLEKPDGFVIGDERRGQRLPRAVAGGPDMGSRQGDRPSVRPPGNPHDRRATAVVGRDAERAVRRSQRALLASSAWH